MTWLFISDLHLSPDRPDITRQFEAFLSTWRGRTRHLYVLGDLFDVWLGDDMGGALGQQVARALRHQREAGAEVALMHGNRDFLLGRRFAESCGATLLTDPCVREIHGRRVLLSHGDLLCTDDHSYQRMRRVFHQPLVQRGFLVLPQRLRQRIGARLRARSQREIADKPTEIMDVNAQAVSDALRRHGVDCLLHGHTHRPAVHPLDLDGRAATRIVLGDWYTQGSALVWDERGFELKQLPRPPAARNGSGTADPGG
ncbi:MAG: UDP-2,3-diacylglucosamine diphosphatase [Gammaproteobacteria bacterium]|nr:MAG: UDP-2,3-diacylglucosamine diphosphatase [Gammaproteobacteria bacterium]